MAAHFWSASLGGDKVSVAKTTTTTAGANVEFRVTDSVTGLSKEEVLKLLELIEYRITEDTWPPA